MALLGAPVRGIWREIKSFKSGGFFGTFGCTSKGYMERIKIFQKWWFFYGKNGCASKVYVVRETSLASLKRERESFNRAHYARLSKVMVFCGTFVAPVRGM